MVIESGKIHFEYLRPFYPLNDKQIRKSPLGNTIVWSIAYEDDLKIEELLEEVASKYRIPYRIRLTSTPYTKEVYSKFSEGVEIHEDVHKELANHDARLKEKGWPLTPVPGGFISTTWILLVRINGNVEWMERGAADILEFLLRVKHYGTAYIEAAMTSPDARREYPLN